MENRSDFTIEDLRSIVTSLPENVFYKLSMSHMTDKNGIPYNYNELNLDDEIVIDDILEYLCAAINLSLSKINKQ